MRHMEKVQKAAKAATELTGDIFATWWVDYAEPLGYMIQVRWSQLAPPGSANRLQDMGMQLVISEDRAGSDPNIHHYVLGVMGELLEDSKNRSGG